MKNSIYGFVIFIAFLFNLSVSLGEDELLKQSFVFDGVDDLILVPHDSTLINPSMTISFDFKLNEGLALKSGNNKTRQFMIFKKNPMEHFNEGITVCYDEAAGNIVATMSNLERKQVYAWSPKMSISKNVWYSVVISADSNALQLYLDSALQKSSKTGFWLYFDDEPFYIGGRSNVLLEHELYGGMLNGEMKNIKFYNKSISELGDSLFFAKDSSLDSSLILDFSNYVTDGIVFDKTEKNNGIYIKGKPTKKEYKEPDFLRVMPNPTKGGKAELVFRLDEMADLKITILDVAGNEIQVLHQGPLKKGEQRIPFYTNTFESGFYVCRLDFGHTNKSTTFIVNK